MSALSARSSIGFLARNTTGVLKRQRRGRRLRNGDRPDVAIDELTLGVADGERQHERTGRRVERDATRVHRTGVDRLRIAVRLDIHGRCDAAANGGPRHPRDRDIAAAFAAGPDADPEIGGAARRLRWKLRERAGHHRRDLGCGCGLPGARHVRHPRRPVAGSRTNLEAVTLHADLDLVELAVHWTVRTVVAEEIERAGLPNNLAQRTVEVVGDDRVPARGGGQREQRVRRPLIPAYLQAARIDGDDRGIRVVCRPHQIREHRGRLIAERAERFAHHDQRLASLTQRSQVQQRALDGAGRDLRANHLDVAHVAKVLLFQRAARRDVDTAPAPELVNLLGERSPIACEADRIERGQRIHERDEIGRTERLEHEPGQLLARAQRRHELPDVILVPENQEHPDVVARGFGSGVFPRADR